MRLITILVILALSLAPQDTRADDQNKGRIVVMDEGLTTNAHSLGAGMSYLEIMMLCRKKDPARSSPLTYVTEALQKAGYHVEPVTLADGEKGEEKIKGLSCDGCIVFKRGILNVKAEFGRMSMEIFHTYVAFIPANGLKQNFGVVVWHKEEEGPLARKTVAESQGDTADKLLMEEDAEVRQIVNWFKTNLRE